MKYDTEFGASTVLIASMWGSDNRWRHTQIFPMNLQFKILWTNSTYPIKTKVRFQMKSLHWKKTCKIRSSHSRIAKDSFPGTLHHVLVQAVTTWTSNPEEGGINDPSNHWELPAPWRSVTSQKTCNCHIQTSSQTLILANRTNSK